MSAARAAAVPQASAFKFILAIRAGPDKGATYQLLPPRASIGRGGGNDVQLTDPRCSRNQATVEFGPAGPAIRDISERSGLSVNGSNVREAPLRDGDVVRMGDTEIVFRIEAPSSAPGAQSSAIAPQAAGSPPRVGANPWGASSDAGYRAGPAPELRRRKPPLKKRSQTPLIIAAIVGLGVVWTLMDAPKEKPKSPAPPTLQTETDEAFKHVEKLRTARDMPAEERDRFLEADRHYKEGFRDMQDGQYDRAIGSFDTAIAIYGKHELASFYRKRALDRREEMISGWMDAGRRFRENMMFARCAVSMDKVIKAIPNPQDLRRKESQALREECEALNEAN